MLAERILARGRETPEEVRQRVMRKVEPFPADVEVVKVSNDGTLEEGIERFVGDQKPVLAKRWRTRLLVREAASGRKSGPETSSACIGALIQHACSHPDCLDRYNPSRA